MDHREGAGMMDLVEAFLSRQVHLSHLTGDDAECIRLFLTEGAGRINLTDDRQVAIAQALVSARQRLNIPFRQMRDADLHTGTEGILGDADSEFMTKDESGRYLQEFVYWLKNHRLASPVPEIGTVHDIIIPALHPEKSSAGRSAPGTVTGTVPPIPRLHPASADGQANQGDFSFFLTLAGIFHTSGHDDLAEMVAEYAAGDPASRNESLAILMEAAYGSGDYSRALSCVTALLESEPADLRYLAYREQILAALSDRDSAGGKPVHRTVEAFYFTNRGGVRARNEDSLLIGERLITGSSMERSETARMDTPDQILCVADGIGGQAKGEIASMMALKGICERQGQITDEKSLALALFQVKSELDDYVNTHPDATYFGCTLAGLCLRGDTVLAFNVGDCRVYRIRDGRFERITRDHSLVQALFEAGVIEEEEMQHHPKKNIVTSSVSGDGSPDSMQVFSTPVTLEDDEQFFICSDGIWECFSHDELELIYRKFKGRTYCERMLTAALARQASDNISAILVRISQWQISRIASLT